MANRHGSKDADKGEVVLENGDKYIGDIVVGADGVHVSSHRILIRKWRETILTKTVSLCGRHHGRRTRHREHWSELLSIPGANRKDAK